MLDNDTYMTELTAKWKMEDFHRTADQLRMASLSRKRGQEKHSKVVAFILHETGKALVSTGNRFLEIA